MKYILILCIVLLSIPSFANNPWDSFLVNDKKVNFNFKNQTANSINLWLTNVSGIPILVDPTFNKPITMGSPQKINISDCFKIYNQMLNFYGYEIVKENKYLVIKKMVKNVPLSKQILGPVNEINNTDSEIKVIHLKNNNSANVAKILNEIFTFNYKIEDLIGKIGSNDTVQPGRQN